MNALPVLDRSNLFQQLKEVQFDLTIIGGGITGAGIALDAASRGLKVALIEKNDFASGTSSKSTKLIHGGLRYLKQMEFRLVQEVGSERAIVHGVAPHLVKPEKMLLPLIEGGTYGKIATSFGLWVYDVLAGVKGDDKRKILNKDKTLQKEPLIRKDILKGSGYYAEYRTDDARLTIENIKTAMQYDAVCLNYVTASELLYEDGKVCGVRAFDSQTEAPIEIKSKFVVSAAGPWVDELRKVDHSLQGKHLFLSKGVHIVVPHERLPINQAVYYDVPDGRMLFAIPRHRSTYIGTTDTPYEGDKNNIPVNLEDVQYLLDGTNTMFPDAKLTMEDVESSWAGLRPLIHEPGKSASEMSRKDEIFQSETGLISIAGGKLTGYRKMAERVVDVVVRRFQTASDKKIQKNKTDKINLTGGPFKNHAEVESYTKEIIRTLRNYSMPDYFGPYLVSNYGRQTDSILEQMNQYEDQAQIALARAEAWFSMRHELALTPLDFLNRRTGRLYFNLPSIKNIKSTIFQDFQAYYSWNENQRDKAEKDLEEAIKQASHFEPHSAKVTSIP